MDSSTALIKYSHIFADCYNSPNCQSFSVISGNTKAGKSVCIDFFAGKQLILYEDVELGTNIVVEKDNCAAEYPPIYIAKGSPSTTLLEGFTLDQ